ncbi:MAG: 3,4-dehydroadipyl-CoA semialdehyde dehydrogenase [Myxococcales bacterium FL481]|nr:MAG: 3,4-dehydroadipyl-CoA semialdehyde dehydrogenase [Myxococcales bacterium FL481]
MTELRSYLGGDWRPGVGDEIALVNPSHAGRIGHVRRAQGLALAVAHARDTGGPALRALTFAQRGRLLERMAAVIHAERDALLDLAGRSGGNTRGDAKFDVDGATAVLSVYAELAKGLGDRSHLIEDDAQPLYHGSKLRAQHVRLPRHGVAVHINAFNFPAWGMIGKAAVALLAGMPVVSKPATSTSALAHRIAELVLADGMLPRGAFSLLMGPAGDLLDHLEPQDVVAFTGSADTGRLIRSHARVLATGARINVEADSLNAAIIGPDVARGTELFDALVRDCTVEMTQKAGQKCTATRRMLVPSALMDDLQEVLVERLDELAARVGDPADRDHRMGPLASAAQLRDVRAGIQRLCECATIVRGDPQRRSFGGEGTEAGFFIEPVLLATTPQVALDATAPVHRTEVFGPVATLLPYDGLAATAGRVVGAGEGSLVSTVYSDDRAFVREVLHQAGPHLGRLVVVQEKTARASLPPGGVFAVANHGGPGRAGGGEEMGGLHGLELYTQRLAVQTGASQLARLLASD